MNKATGKNIWLVRSVKMPASRPLTFEQGANISGYLNNWPLEQIVKCLIFYHLDDDERLKTAQEERVKQLYQACLQSGHELLLELILPEGMPKTSAALLGAISRFYELGIYPDWWKLEP